MSALKWQDPPAAGGHKTGSAKWTAVAAELRANPGRWALVAEGVQAATVTQINMARFVAFRPAGTFQAKGHSRADGKHDVWARYIGGEA